MLNCSYRLPQDGRGSCIPPRSSIRRTGQQDCARIVRLFRAFTYHVRYQITVGDPARARIVAKYFDSPWNLTTVQNGFDAGLGAPENNVDTNGHRSSPLNESAAVLELHSERGFLTLTGTYKSVPVSVVAIGMGAPNMDFFVREGREVLDEAGEGEMIVIRCVPHSSAVLANLVLTRRLL